MNPTRDIINAVLVVVNVLAGLVGIYVNSYVLAALNFSAAGFLCVIWILAVYREYHQEIMEILKKMQKS